MDRRQFIKTSGYVAAATGSGLLLPASAFAADAIAVGSTPSPSAAPATWSGLLVPASAFAAEDIPVGSIHDLSGGLDIYGKPMVDALTLAIEEQNAAGGLLGKKVRLVSYDAQD